MELKIHVQSAAAAATKGNYEICSKIAYLPHRHAKQPGRTCQAAGFAPHFQKPRLGAKEFTAGQKCLEVIQPVDRAPCKAVSQEPPALVPVPVEPIPASQEMPGLSLHILLTLKFLSPGNIYLG